jgi:catechol 2,3-dioxygenase-like lactoylglutathione lyase family enzyme
MITRFDHAVIGVRDLPAAMARYRELGFVVVEGGRHTGIGTCNALVRFGLDYLELISVCDQPEAEAAGGNSAALARALRERDSALVGYALATDQIEGLAVRFRERGLEAAGPVAMERLRPDGRLLSWRLLIPFGASWLTPWPFFIQWDDADDDRLRLERPAVQPNGVQRVEGVRLMVKGLERASELYERQLGLGPAEVGEEPLLDAQRRRYRLGTLAIDLLTPSGPGGPVAAALEAAGEGVFEVVLGARDVERLEHAYGGRREGDRLLLPPDRLLGVRLSVVAMP